MCNMRPSHTLIQGPKIQRLVTANRLQRKRAEKAAKVKRGEATKTATKEYVTHQSLRCLPLTVFPPIHDLLCSCVTHPSLTLHSPLTYPSLTRVFQVRQAQGRARQGGEGAAPREVLPPCIFDRQEPLNGRVVVVVIERIVTLFWANKCATKNERRGAGARGGFGANFCMCSLWRGCCGQRKFTRH